MMAPIEECWLASHLRNWHKVVDISSNYNTHKTTHTYRSTNCNQVYKRGNGVHNQINNLLWRRDNCTCGSTSGLILSKTGTFFPATLAAVTIFSKSNSLSIFTNTPLSAAKIRSSNVFSFPLNMHLILKMQTQVSFLPVGKIINWSTTDCCT